MNKNLSGIVGCFSHGFLKGILAGGVGVMTTNVTGSDLAGVVGGSLLAIPAANTAEYPVQALAAPYAAVLFRKPEPSKAEKFIHALGTALGMSAMMVGSAYFKARQGITVF